MLHWMYIYIFSKVSVEKGSCSLHDENEAQSPSPFSWRGLYFILDLSHSLLKIKMKNLLSRHLQKLPSRCSPLDIMCIDLTAKLGIDLKINFVSRQQL